MTGRQRFYDYLEGKQVDRVPNFNIAIYFAAKYGGVPFESRRMPRMRMCMSST